MNFFRYFPVTPYSFTTNTSVQLDITELTSHVIILEKLKQHIAVLYDYLVEDGERPDSVATKVYGGPEFTWIILTVNDIRSFYDWPLSMSEFSRYITDKYGSIPAAQALPIYRTAQGIEVDATTYSLLAGSDQGSPTTAYDKELLANEAKRRIKILPIDFAAALTSELKRVFL